MVVVTLRTVTERVRSLARRATLRVGVRFQGCDVMRGGVKRAPKNHPDHRIKEKRQNAKGTTLWICVQNIKSAKP